MSKKDDDRRWRIDTTVGIGVALVVALIGFGGGVLTTRMTINSSKSQAATAAVNDYRTQLLTNTPDSIYSYIDVVGRIALINEPGAPGISITCPPNIRDLYRKAYNSAFIYTEPSEWQIIEQMHRIVETIPLRSYACASNDYLAKPSRADDQLATMRTKLLHVLRAQVQAGAATR